MSTQEASKIEQLSADLRAMTTKVLRLEQSNRRLASVVSSLAEENERLKEELAAKRVGAGVLAEEERHG